MAIAAGLYRLIPTLHAIGCAKLLHPLGLPCIHCGHEPAVCPLTAARNPVRER